jgi:hypothetical protein
MIGRFFLSPFPVTPALERRVSLKRFFSLQSLNLKTVRSSPWMWDQPVGEQLPMQDIHTE